MPVRSSRGIAALTARLLMASTLIAPTSAAIADCVGGLGVSRIVEIDTTGGPLFGGITKQAREKSFLGPKEVVLTFDDGPMPGVTRPILDTLDTFCTKATFFSVGKMAIAYPAQVREIMRRGHTLGTHTWSHPMSLPRLRGEQARDQIESGFAAVTIAAGQPIAPFFRFPGLNDSPALLGHLESRDIATFTVDVVSNDSYISDPSRLIQRTLREAEHENGGILLFHDIKPQTARALPAILAELKARGFRVVHMRAKAPFKTDEHYLNAVRDQIGAKNPSALRALVAMTDATPAPSPAAAIATQRTESQPDVAKAINGHDAATARSARALSAHSPAAAQAASQAAVGAASTGSRAEAGGGGPIIAPETPAEAGTEIALEPQGLERAFIRRAGRIIHVPPSTADAGAQRRPSTIGDAGPTPVDVTIGVTASTETVQTTPIASAMPSLVPPAAVPQPATPVAQNVPPPATAPVTVTLPEQPNDHRRPRIINAEPAQIDASPKSPAAGTDAKIASPLPVDAKPEPLAARAATKVELPVPSVAALTPQDAAAAAPTTREQRSKNDRRSRLIEEAAAPLEPHPKSVATTNPAKTQPNPAGPSVAAPAPLAPPPKAAAIVAVPVPTALAQPAAVTNASPPVIAAPNGIEVLAGTYATVPAPSPAAMANANAKPEQPGRFAAPEIIAGSYRAPTPPPAGPPAPRRTSKAWHESFADQMRNGN